MDLHRAAELVKAELDATELDPADPLTCPSCHRPTQLSHTGQRTYCLRCTETSMGGDMLDNALRIEARLTWKGYRARVAAYGYPWDNPGPWTTPKTRRKK